MGVRDFLAKLFPFEEEGELLFCTDCKWCVPAKYGDEVHRTEYARCGRIASMVNGEPEYYCSTHRSSSSKTKCGPEGRYWEPKE